MKCILVSFTVVRYCRIR